MIPIIILAMEDDSDRNFMINLYTNHYKIMKYQAYKIVKDEKVAEDMVQTACVKLIEHIVTIRKLGENSLAAYTVTTVKRISINHMNQRYTKDRNKTNLLDDEFLKNVVDKDTNLENEVLRKISAEELSIQLQKLPQMYYDILKYKFFLELENTEIAELMGVKESSVRVYLKRAKEKAYEIALYHRESIDGGKR